MSTESIVPSMHMVVFRDTKILVKCRVLVPDVKMPRYLGFGRPCFRRTVPTSQLWSSHSLPLHRQHPSPRSKPTNSDTMAASKVKILCLHGFTSSAARLARQLAPVVSASAPWASFHFVDAPFAVEPGYAWWRAQDRTGPEGEYAEYEGWPTSRSYLHDVLREQGPFDGVLGFSQGAVVTSLLCLMPEFRDRFDFGVLVGGFKARDPELRKNYAEGNEGFKRSSLHVWGTQDDIVPPRASEKLSEMFTDPKLIVHS